MEMTKCHATIIRNIFQLPIQTMLMMQHRSQRWLQLYSGGGMPVRNVDSELRTELQAKNSIVRQRLILSFEDTTAPEDTPTPEASTIFLCSTF